MGSCCFYIEKCSDILNKKPSRTMGGKLCVKRLVVCGAGSGEVRDRNNTKYGPWYKCVMFTHLLLEFMFVDYLHVSGVGSIS